MKSCHDEGYATDLITAEVVKCVNEYSAEDAPFFLYVAYNASHAPYMVPDDVATEYIDPEQDYGKGKKGFVPPVEWKVTVP